jgi:hypothetical protein
LKVLPCSGVLVTLWQFLPPMMSRSGFPKSAR